MGCSLLTLFFWRKLNYNRRISVPTPQMRGFVKVVGKQCKLKKIMNTLIWGGDTNDQLHSGQSRIWLLGKDMDFLEEHFTLDEAKADLRFKSLMTG